MTRIKGEPFALDIGGERHGVISLHERIQKLVDADRLTARMALAEIVAFEHAGNRVLRRQPDHAGRAQFAHPRRIELDAGSLAIEDLEDLRRIGLGVRAYFILRQRRPRRVLAGRIADHPREIADQKDHLVAEVLELAHLVDQHGVAEVQIGSGRIETRLDPERPSLGEPGGETAPRQYLLGAAREFRQLRLNALVSRAHASLACWSSVPFRPGLEARYCSTVSRGLRGSNGGGAW